MNVYTIENLTLDEIKLLRQSLNIIQITGVSAQFVANLQLRIDRELLQIDTHVKEEESKKAKGLERILRQQASKGSS